MAAPQRGCCWVVVDSGPWSPFRLILCIRIGRYCLKVSPFGADDEPADPPDWKRRIDWHQSQSVRQCNCAAAVSGAGGGGPWTVRSPGTSDMLNLDGDVLCTSGTEPTYLNGGQSHSAASWKKPRPWRKDLNEARGGRSPGPRVLLVPPAHGTPNLQAEPSRAGAVPSHSQGHLGAGWPAESPSSYATAVETGQPRCSFGILGSPQRNLPHLNLSVSRAVRAAFCPHSYRASIFTTQDSVFGNYSISISIVQPHKLSPCPLALDRSRNLAPA
jgi:hypothetical protein